MYIKRIKLSNFRNYENEEIELTNGINVFFGDNAQGKTNILEAIFICAMGKSFRTKREKELIQLGKNISKIEIEYEKSDRDGKIKIELSDKKCVYFNGVKLKKLSEILGNLNIVIFSPDDINILKNGPANRRKFLDMMISQLRPAYIYNLNLYLKTLEQRNNYLRQIKFENKDKNLIEIWNEKLADYGIKVYQYRKEFINKITERINKFHNEITNSKENIRLEYSSDCIEKEKYLKILNISQVVDISKGYTSKGIHRDDFSVFINEKQVNVYGSQGQHRTAILSLKLSELDIIFDEIGEYPILLLDDFMSELDKKRRENFIKNISNNQVLITCTDEIELKGIRGRSYKVKEGKIIK